MLFIPRNTAIPCRKSDTYTTEEDWQTEIDVIVYEGERASVDACNELGKFTITGLERAKRGEPQVVVTFDIDANGILSVTAVDKVTNARGAVTITSTTARNSKADVARMVADAEKYASADAALKQKVEARRMLEERLFTLDDIFRPRLLIHRGLCTDMQKLRFVDVIKASSECQKLEDFSSEQQKQKEKISEKIQDCSERCRANVKYAIENMLSELRERIISELALDEEQRKNNPSSATAMNNQGGGGMKHKKSNSVFENLGFPDHMTYGHRSNLRKECSRFLRFAYLVDFLALESLTSIYIDTVKEFIERLQQLDTSNNNVLTENDVY